MIQCGLQSIEELAEDTNRFPRHPVGRKQKGTPLHAASVVGDTVGDPFKDTSSVALNPVIKFTTLFGLLAVDLAVTLDHHVRLGLALAFFLVSAYFVWRSFYGMRIESAAPGTPSPATAPVGTPVPQRP